MENKDIIELINSLDAKIIAALIAAIVSIIVGALSLILSYRTHREQIIEKRKEERRKEIYKKLNEFYGPFQQYLNTSKEFFKIFKVGKPKEFMTLTYLLDPEQEYLFEDGTKGKITLSDTDKELLQQIFHVGQKIEDLIVEKAGLVDDPELRYNFKTDPSITDARLESNGLLAFAKAHFQIIKLAYLGKFKGEIDKFKDYVFPRELPTKIEERIKALQTELKELNS